MKIVKVLAAIVISFVLLCTQGLLLGTFSCDKATSSKTIAKSIESNDFALDIYDTATITSSTQLTPAMKAMVQSALNTSAASDAMGKYASASVHSVLYGQDANAFTAADLNQLMEDSLNEMAQDGGIPMTNQQRQQALDYVSAHSSQIVEEMNRTLPVAENAEYGPDMGTLQYFLSTPVRAIMGILVLVLGILLLALFWRSKLGFVWWATVSFICGSVFFLLGMSSDLLSQNIGQQDGTIIALLLTDIFSQGFIFVSAIALAFTAVLLVLCFILRRVSS